MTDGGGGEKRPFRWREQHTPRSRGMKDQGKLGHRGTEGHPHPEGPVNHGPQSGCFSEDVWECTQGENRKRKERMDPKKYQYLADRGRRIQKSQKKNHIYMVSILFTTDLGDKVSAGITHSMFWLEKIRQRKRLHV